MGIPLEFEGLCNARDLAGMRTRDGRVVKRGRLYRSDQLFFASDNDLAWLVRANIGLVVDFRSDIEHGEKPDPDIDGAKQVHLPVIRDMQAGITRDSASNKSIMKAIMSGKGIELSEIDAYMSNTYRQFVVDPYANEQYARFFDELLATLEAGKAVLWHCTAGKDRAGFATAIVLCALGVGRRDIVADYLQTNACIAGVSDQLIGLLQDQVAAAGEEAIDASKLEGMKGAFNHFFRADEAFIAGAFDAADELFGSFEGFLEQGLGIDSAKSKTLRDLCLED